MQGETQLVVVNGLSTLRLRTLDVSIRGFQLHDELGERDRLATPRGSFVRISLRVRNKTGRSQVFAAGQTLLAVAGRQYEEDVRTEHRNHEGAFAFGKGKTIAPGATVGGDVVYDVPLEEVERVTSEGLLLVANFDEGRPAKRPAQVGQFRIYMR